MIKTILLFVLLAPQLVIADDVLTGNRSPGRWFGGGALTAFSFNATNDDLEIGHINTTGSAFSYDQICFPILDNAGNPPAYKVGVQGVATSGDPIRADGSYASGSGECSGSYDGPNDASHDNTLQCVTVTGTTCSIAAGALFSIDVDDTGTPDGSNYAQFGYVVSSMWADIQATDRSNIPWATTVDGGGAASNAQVVPTFFLRNSSTGAVLGTPVKDATIQNYFDNASNPDEYCNRLYATLPTGCTYKVRGMVVGWGSSPSAGGSGTARLLNSAGTTLDDVAWDADQVLYVNSSGQHEYLFDDSLDSLSSATEYFLCFKNDGGANGYIQETEVWANADLTAWPMGKEVYKCTRNNGSGAPSCTTTRRMNIGPIFDSITCSASGGGRSQNLKTGLGGL